MMKNRWFRITRYAIVFGVLAVGIYDLAAYAFGGYEATISQRLLGAFEVSPIIPLAIGVIIGHLAWPQRLWTDPRKGGTP